MPRVPQPKCVFTSTSAADSSSQPCQKVKQRGSIIQGETGEKKILFVAFHPHCMHGFRTNNSNLFLQSKAIPSTNFLLRHKHCVRSASASIILHTHTHTRRTLDFPTLSLYVVVMPSRQRPPPISLIVKCGRKSHYKNGASFFLFFIQGFRTFA